jgi:hypothetical protein
MTCYQISESGELVALVANLGLAQAIIQCQPPGYYQVDEVEVGDPAGGARSRARRHSITRRGGRGRRRQINKRPVRWSYRPVTLAIGGLRNPLR